MNRYELNLEPMKFFGFIFSFFLILSFYLVMDDIKYIIPPSPNPIEPAYPPHCGESE